MRGISKVEAAFGDFDFVVIGNSVFVNIELKSTRNDVFNCIKTRNVNTIIRIRMKITAVPNTLNCSKLRRASSTRNTIAEISSLKIS